MPAAVDSPVKVPASGALGVVDPGFVVAWLMLGKDLPVGGDAAQDGGGVVECCVFELRKRIPGVGVAVVRDVSNHNAPKAVQHVWRTGQSGAQRNEEFGVAVQAAGDFPLVSGRRRSPLAGIADDGASAGCARNSFRFVQRSRQERDRVSGHRGHRHPGLTWTGPNDAS